MNIIVIVIDTLRYDYLGANGNSWIQTPNLDRLAAEALVFDRAFAASYPTIPHRTDLMTGRYGSPFHAWQPLAFDVPTLPRMLAEEAGYCTQLIHDTPHLVNGGHNFDWPFHAWTFIRGAEVDRPWLTGEVEWPANWRQDPSLDDYLKDEDPSAPNALLDTYCRANRGRRKPEDWNCARLFRTAAQFLQDNASRDNFLLWVDCFDPHEPWDAPPEFVLKYDHTPGYDGRLDPRLIKYRNNPELPETARERVKATYAAKLSWMDHCLGGFLDTFEMTGLGKNTAVVLTADHGTNAGERGKFGKGYPVREQEARVPLLIRTPGDGPGRSDILVQPQDIFAAVLGLAGVKVPEDTVGHDVFSLARKGGEDPRNLVLAGSAANPGWAKKGILFTVFDRDWQLELAARPADSRLTRLGSLESIEKEHPEVVARLHAAGLAELERRGAVPELVAWLRGGGGGEFPAGCRFHEPWPKPAGYTSYFGRLYLGN